MSISRQERENLEAVLSEHSGKKVRIITTETPGICKLCGAHEETRPYGPNGEEICYACGQKNPEMTARQFAKYRHGVDLTDEQAKVMSEAVRERERIDAEKNGGGV